MQAFVNIGRIAGVQIGIHYTWLLIAVLITVSFIGYLSNTHPLCQTRSELRCECHNQFHISDLKL